MSKDTQLFEDVKKRLNMLCEYDAKKGLNEFVIMPGTTVEEAGEDENASSDDGAGGEQPPMGGDANVDGGMDANSGGMPNMGGDPNGGGMPNMGGDPNGGGMPPMDGDPNAAGGMDPNAGAGAQTPEGFNPQEPMPQDGGDLSAESFDTEQPGDEVLDVTELTDKQDEIEDEIHEVGGKFDEVLKAIGSFEELIKANDEKLEDLRAEIERRNPTQIEKLGNQKTLSYPFNVSPEDYWKEKEATSNYSTEDDDNGKEQGQYVITANDVNGDTNWQEIAKSLEDKDFLYNQTLDKLLKF